MKATMKVSLILFLLGIFISSGFAQEENRKGSNFDKETRVFCRSFGLL